MIILIVDASIIPALILINIFENMYNFFLIFFEFIEKQHFYTLYIFSMKISIDIIFEFRTRD